jgi:magnesium chelatase subunit I
VAATFRARLGGLELGAFTSAVEQGQGVATGELVTAAELLSQLGQVPLASVLDRLGEEADPGHAAAALELVLEGLHLNRRLDKVTGDDGRMVYRR